VRLQARLGALTVAKPKTPPSFGAAPVAEYQCGSQRFHRLPPSWQSIVERSAAICPRCAVEFVLRPKPDGRRGEYTWRPVSRYFIRPNRIERRLLKQLRTQLSPQPEPVAPSPAPSSPAPSGRVGSDPGRV